MPMTNDFRNLIATMAVGEGFTAFDNANAHLGVGDSNLSFSSSQDDLQGSNKERKPMTAGYPTKSYNQMVFLARFSEADAVFNWQEAGVFNADTGGIMMNRLLDALGTKPNDEIWDYQITIDVVHGSA